MYAQANTAQYTAAYGQYVISGVGICFLRSKEHCGK
jgi:hypothetical protein